MHLILAQVSYCWLVAFNSGPVALNPGPTAFLVALNPGRNLHLLLVEADLIAGRYRYSDAEPLYQQALELRKRLLGEEHPDVAQSLNNLAGLYRNQGRYSEAEPLYQEAIIIATKTLGENHPNTKTISQNYQIMKKVGQTHLNLKLLSNVDFKLC